jgi:hypothetical protein
LSPGHRGEKTVKKIVCFLFVALLLGGALWSHANDSTAEQWVTREDAKAAIAYWTPERMRNAKPHPMEVVPDPNAAKVPDSGATGPPGADKAGFPDNHPSALLSGDGFAALVYTGAFAGESATATRDAYAYPFPHNTFRVPDYLYGTSAYYFPYAAIGKVYFTNYALQNMMCSGSSIGGRAVLTAGHCVSDGSGHFHTKLIFIPSWRNGLEPTGKWTSSWATAFNDWHLYARFGRDVAFFTVFDKNIGGTVKKLSAAVGNLGFAANQSRVQMWNSFGYPANAPLYNGAWLINTQGSYATTGTAYSPNTTGIGSTMGGGCSGGPWILRFMNGNYAGGVNSHISTGTVANELRLYTPYFDTAVNTMKTTAASR